MSHSDHLVASGISALREGELRVRLHKEFDEAFASTQLPDRPDYNWANEFLLKARREMA